MTPATKTPLAGATAPSKAKASEPMTLRALFDAYMAQYTGRDRSRVVQLSAWRELLGERPYASITDDDVFHALDRLREAPARVYVGRDAEGKRILRGKKVRDAKGRIVFGEKGRRSPATVNRYHAALMAVFTWAIKRRLAPRGFENPARKVERSPEKNAVVRFLSDAERERLLASCRESTWPRLYCLVLMAITTGARRGELLALTWGDVDLGRAIAHVKSSKNDHPRALPLVPKVLAELERFASARAEACLFPSRSRLSAPRHFETSWLAALERAKIHKFRFHDLRHSCASYLAQNGASLLEIADVMGHRQLAMVRRYAHLTTDTKAKLVNRVLGGIK